MNNELKFVWFDTAEACASSAAAVFALNNWRWYVVGVPSRDVILKTLLQLQAHYGQAHAETGRLVVEDGKFGHEKSPKAIGRS